ncbi:hypothetical protein CCYA_CCYA18G4601 [Cyanidiococcus yangmingshanensis]|nr:hypothetical protein CCYA_CCYA18G4601 [Cyanidiococcus yangmingshanensis]
MASGKRRRRPSVQELHGHAHSWDGPAFPFLLPLGAADWRVRFDPQAGPIAGRLVVPNRRPALETAFPDDAGRQYSVDGFYTTTCSVSSSAPATAAATALGLQAPGDPRELTRLDASSRRSLRLLPPYPSCPNDASDERTLLVLNVNKSATEAYIAAQFGRYGQVEKVLIHRDDQGRSMGFVSIHMHSRDECRQAARSMHEKTLMGMRVQVFVDPDGQAAAARRQALIDKRIRWEKQQREQIRAQQVVGTSSDLSESGARPLLDVRASSRLVLGANEQRRDASTRGVPSSGPLAEEQQTRAYREPNRCVPRSGTVPNTAVNSEANASKASLNPRSASGEQQPERGHDRHAIASQASMAPRHAPGHSSPSSSGPRTDAVSLTSREASVWARGHSNEECFTVRVMGVPSATPESVLRTAFRRFGRIIRIRQLAETETSEPLNKHTELEPSSLETLTFVIHFGSREQAREAAARMDQHMLMGKRVRVVCAQDDRTAKAQRATGGISRMDEIDDRSPEHQGILERKASGVYPQTTDRRNPMSSATKLFTEHGTLAPTRPSVADTRAISGDDVRQPVELGHDLAVTADAASTVPMHAVRLTTLPFNTTHYELSEALAGAPCRARCLARVPFWYVLFIDAADLVRFMRWLQHRNQELLGCSMLCEPCRVSLDEQGSKIQTVSLIRNERIFASRLELLDSIGDILESQIRNAVLRDLHREILDQVAQLSMEAFESHIRDKLARQRLDTNGDMRTKGQRTATLPLPDERELGMWPRLRRPRYPESEAERSPDEAASLSVPDSDEETGTLVAESAPARHISAEAISKKVPVLGDTLNLAEDVHYLQHAWKLYFQVCREQGMAPTLSAETESLLTQMDITSSYGDQCGPWLARICEQYWAACEPKLGTLEPPENTTGCARSEGYAPFSRDMKLYRWKPPKQVIVPADEARRWSATGGLRGSRVEQRQLLSAVSDKEQTLLYLQSRERLLRFFRSGIHGYGLWALEDIPSGEYIIEYRGELVRSAVADLRERAYRQQGMGDSFMFRIDADTVVDATHIGSVARFVNHSCDPNSTARIVQLGGSPHILFYSRRAISIGEEITYDYHFDVEDDAAEKIPCMCGAPNCRHYLN